MSEAANQQPVQETVTFRSSRKNFTDMDLVYKAEVQTIVSENGRNVLHTISKDSYIKFERGAYTTSNPEIIAFLRNHELFAKRHPSGHLLPGLFYEAAKVDPRIAQIQQLVSTPGGLDYLARQINQQYAPPAAQVSDPVAASLQQQQQVPRYA